MNWFTKHLPKRHSHPLYIVFQEEQNGGYTLIAHALKSKKEYLNMKADPDITILGEFNDWDKTLDRLHMLYNSANYINYTYDYNHSLTIN